MKKNLVVTILTLSITIFSYSQETNKFDNPNVNFKSIEKDFIQWWTYHNENIILSSNFIAIDNSSNIISKEVFLQNLTSGDFIPLKLDSENKATYYKLYRLDQTADKNIRNTIKQTSSISYEHFKMEGKNFPEFNFKDLNEIEYTTQNTKNKIIILKTWFIACKACVAEMPELNELTKKYNDRKDTVFISLALDSDEDLNQFLLKKQFNYAVVSKQKDFINNKLNANIYPTHIVIDKNGVIKKVINKASELILYLENENIMNADLMKKIPPPPPPPASPM